MTPDRNRSRAIRSAQSEQVEENVSATGWTLTGDEMTQIERILARLDS